MALASQPYYVRFQVGKLEVTIERSTVRINQIARAQDRWIETAIERQITARTDARQRRVQLSQGLC